MPDDATESVTTHSSRLQPSGTALTSGTTSAGLVPKFTTLKSGMTAQVFHDNDWASWSSVHSRTQTRTSQAKGKSLIARPPMFLVYNRFI